jgi:hypothetical protein
MYRKWCVATNVAATSALRVQLDGLRACALQRQAPCTSTAVLCMQTPTPHPNAYRVPRACASRPVRGPLDDYFCTQPAKKRSASLPVGMDSCTRKAGRARAPAGGTSHQLQTPAFTGLDPRPGHTAEVPPSEADPTTADFNILHKAVPHSTSSDMDEGRGAASTGRTTRSLTPRLSSLSMSAIGTTAGLINTQLGANADTTLQGGLRSVQAAHMDADTDMDVEDAAPNKADDRADAAGHSRAPGCSQPAKQQSGRRRRRTSKHVASAPAGHTVNTRAHARAQRPFQSPCCTQKVTGFSPSLQLAPQKAPLAVDSDLAAGQFAERAESMDLGSNADFAGKSDANMNTRIGAALGLDTSGDSAAMEAGGASCSHVPAAKRHRRALAERDVNTHGVRSLRGGVRVRSQPAASAAGKPGAPHGFGLSTSGLP